MTKNTNDSSLDRFSIKRREEKRKGTYKKEKKRMTTTKQFVVQIKTWTSTHSSHHV